MAKKDGMDAQGPVGDPDRRARMSDKGWNDRVEVDKDPGKTVSYGWGKDGVEGRHKAE